MIMLASKEPPLVRWPLPTRRILAPAHFEHQPMGNSPGQPSPVTVGEAIGDLPYNPAASPDVAVDYASPPQFPYQEWARGFRSVHELVETPRHERSAQTLLELAAT
jgi:hypothetical protein